MQFDLVSPEKRVASFEATAVDLPGSEGDMTAMEGHAALISALRPGIVSCVGDKETNKYVISGGFAEITSSSVVVLADRVFRLEEFTRETKDGLVEYFLNESEGKSGLELDLASKKVADAKAIEIQ
ncbi:MAG: ATP synthase F1 subunit epsilon [Rhodobacteraceae bacterium]|nr:ATP synthase F1 subunit epsilon [Paracoccaceae bacterium]